ncbi:MAG: hypothetical protein ACI9G1_001471 [Pirellulaceae bacterium]
MVTNDTGNVADIEAESGTATESHFAPQRFIVLGASNVARGISTVFQYSKLMGQGPVEFLTAMGHGRSYGGRSRVLGRSLPGIRKCGLWNDLERLPAAATGAMLTDVGNDLLYGASGEQIVQWVTECLQKLEPHTNRLVVTGIPLPGLRKLTSLRFRIIRTMLFPKSTLQLDDALRAAEFIDEKLQQLAPKFGGCYVPPDDHWYGIDPIHIKLRHWKSAWGKYFSGIEPTTSKKKSTKTSPLLWLRLRLVVPRQRWWFGIEQTGNQPAWKMSDGTKISFY